LTPTELLAFADGDSAVERLADAVTLTVDDEIDERFPQECLARVEVVTGERTYESSVTRPRGSRNRPLSSARQRAKVERLCAPMPDTGAIDRVEQLLCDRDARVAEVLAPWE